MSHTITLCVYCGLLGENDIEFVVDYSPGTPAVMYLSNGDPGYPGDPCELEIVSATCNGVDITKAFDFGESASLYDQLLDKAAEAQEAEQEDRRGEYEADRREERMLEARGL